MLGVTYFNLEQFSHTYQEQILIANRKKTVRLSSLAYAHFLCACFVLSFVNGQSNHFGLGSTLRSKRSPYQRKGLRILTAQT